MTGVNHQLLLQPMRRLFLTALLSMVITGCAVSPPESGGIVDPEANWRLLARVGIRHGDAAESFSLTWQQRREAADIRLNGTLGVSVANIRVTPGIASIEIPGRGSFQADNASQLLYEHTGVLMPLELLTFWVRGNPAPTLPWQNTVSGFEQSGWQIKIDKVVDDLPMKLVFLKGDTSIKMAVRSWQ
jgi:outer membrane lipoprotein LolB